MSAAAKTGGRRKKKAHHEEEHENEERWLVSFADMMTLLFCLFMVLFAISSVNVSKLEVLQAALQDAFSGQILPGGKAVMESGAQTEPRERAAAEPPLPALTPLQAMTGQPQSRSSREETEAANREEQGLRDLKRRIDRLAKEEGLKGKVETRVDRRGLVVRLLTDKVFFDSGRATLKAPAVALLSKLAAVLAGEGKHPIVIEGHTDAQPVASGAFPSNWELSGVRAGSVARTFQRSGVLRQRMAIAGHAETKPVATNATPVGRARNRRVEVVLTRIHEPQSAGRRP